MSSAQQAESCTQNCIQISREDFAASKKAFDEVRASRVVIDKQGREIELLQENSRLKNELNKALKENSALKDGQLAEKGIQLAAEREAREKTEKQLTIQTKEKEKAQRSAKFWRKIGTAAGAALAAIFIPRVL